ncbi:uncharacterized protein LOC131667842 isoform X2 [Phymastichus coffea]|uniref:uncharacterized protein LOC131667842 isoform X2 n=1 Tax=Phymastichus coffea TaxID=108790 RepID=UPI00273C455E|nr:uncharacterized protein LOC131667842 isoform X2 [Phymastichus coffea]
MFSRKSHIQYLSVVLLLSVYLFKQVSSIGCYACDSDENRNCIYDPSQFAVTCVPYAKNINSSASNGEVRAISYDCATAVGISTKDGHFRVIRGCSVSPVTCDTYKAIYAVNYDFQVDKCLRCSYNFCNTDTF